MGGGGLPIFLGDGMHWEICQTAGRVVILVRFYSIQYIVHSTMKINRGPFGTPLLPDTCERLVCSRR